MAGRSPQAGRAFVPSAPSQQAVSPVPASIPNANGPELWRAILERMPHGSIVAGGAVRDFLLGKEPKDIDVFMGVPPASEEVDFEALCDLNILPDPRHGLFRIENTHERYEEYAAVSCILCVSSGEMFGRKVDAVEIEHFQGGAELINEFDFGITRCWFDGNEIHDTDEARTDRENKTITLLSDARKERSLARFERLNERWGGNWQLVIDAQAIEAQRAETTKIGSVEDESAVAKPCAQTPPSSTQGRE